MLPRRAFQFGLKSLLSLMTVTGIVFGIHTCPPPVGPLLMKAAGGMLVFVPILLAIYLADACARRW